MQSVGSLIDEYLKERKMVPNQLAKQSGVPRQRLGEMIKKNRCPAEHNFRSLLKVMDLDSEKKKVLIDTYQNQRKNNADHKLKTGRNMREEALSKKILEHYEIRVIPSFDHRPCTQDVECDFENGLNCILNCLDKNMQRDLRDYQQTKDELQEYFDDVEAKSGMEMETFASAYRTRVGLWITFYPRDRTKKAKLRWVIESIFDGLVINRSGFPFTQLLWDVPLHWNAKRYPRKRKRKAHAVSIRSRAVKDNESVEEDAEYFATLRNFSLPRGKSAKRLSSSDIYRAISKELTALALDLSSQKKQDTVPIRCEDIYELCDNLHQMLTSQRKGKSVHSGTVFRLHSVLSRLRIAPIASQFEAVLLHWASLYFQDLANNTQ